MRLVNPESTDRVRSSQVFQDVVADEGNAASFEVARRDVLDELFLRRHTSRTTSSSWASSTDDAETHSVIRRYSPLSVRQTGAGRFVMWPRALRVATSRLRWGTTFSLRPGRGR
jgi:hypothetical protein